MQENSLWNKCIIYYIFITPFLQQAQGDMQDCFTPHPCITSSQPPYKVGEAER